MKQPSSTVPVKTGGFFNVFAHPLPALTGSPSPVQWGVLIALSAVFYVILDFVGVPAAMLLGAMLAGIAVAAAGCSLAVPAPAFLMAQGIIGGMIAGILPASLSGEALHNWPLFTAGVLSVIVASSLLGWLMTRMKVLPGRTIVWGISPGAATVMVIMAENDGADAQLVALMQYLRVILAAAIASLIARMFGAQAHQAVQSAAWFGPVDWPAFAETLTMIVVCVVASRLVRMPVGALFFPLVAGIVLSRLGWMTIELPQIILAAGYAFVGWKIGLCFKRPLIVHAAKAFPRIVLCTMMLIVACGALGGLLVLAAGVDPLTAYLATSPGGADSVAIIAASSSVDKSLVMTMQMSRAVTVLVIGPVVAGFIAKHTVNVQDFHKI